jgi:dihydrofolate reductase
VPATVPRSVYYLAATLDGFIATEDDGIEWLTGYEGSSDVEGAVEIKPVMGGFIDSVTALAMGSATYEWVAENASAWPYEDKPTWVFTSRGELPAMEGANLRFVSGEVAALAGEMLEAAGDGPLWIVGGGDLAVQFAEAGLLDEVVVTVVPVALGRGKPLFGRPLGRRLTLTACQPFTTGMVELTYAVGD